MTVLPITPSIDQIDPKSLSFICRIDKVAITFFEKGVLTDIGQGHLVAYITSDPDAEQQVLLLRFFSLEEEKCTIVLVSRSKAWLQDDYTLIFPRAEGGFHRVDCSLSEKAAFTELQDVLTFFIKYENRHCMKNTLAMVDSASCQITQVVADNVQLERNKEESVLDEETFISTHENAIGQKLPVYVDTEQLKESIDPSKIRKVKLLYHSGNAIVSGSDLIAQALVLAGQLLSKGITSGGKMLEDKIEPLPTSIKLSNQNKRIFQTVYEVSGNVTHMAAGLVDVAVTTAVSNINELVYKNEEMQRKEPIQNASRYFGISALQASVKIVGGAASAASAVLASSRDSIVQMVHKKYGTDVGDMAEKTMGATSNGSKMLVYFDAKGISRRVVVSDGSFLKDQQNGSSSGSSTGKASTTIQSQHKQQANEDVIFENNWLEEETEKKGKRPFVEI